VVINTDPHNDDLTHNNFKQICLKIDTLFF
jgi:hypothetical protein